MDQQTIRALCAADMTAVNELILARLQSDVSLINQLGFYIVSAGGKRMRPMLTVMAARALGYEGEDHLKLAAIIEFIHTSTCCTTTWSTNPTCAAAGNRQRPVWQRRQRSGG